jgi:hypothetical protein
VFGNYFTLYVERESCARTGLEALSFITSSLSGDCDIIVPGAERRRYAAWRFRTFPAGAIDA